jgi:signal transduction histidine kinase
MNRQPCILVVDDELANRCVLEAILEPEGFKVIHAKTGCDALVQIEHEHVDLVLLDIMMPGVDGIETCRRIREELARPLLPVIVVSALSDRVSRTRAKTAGADDLLVKPIYEDELIARIRTLLTRNAYYSEAERERARAEAEARRWKLVSDVASVVSRCTDYETLQLSIRDVLRNHLPIHRFVVLEMNGDALQLSSTSRSLRPPASKIPAARWRELWRERCVVAAEALASELAPLVDTFYERCAVHGAVLPLHAGATLQGVLAVFTTRALSGDEMSLVDELGPHLTNAVANVRSHVKAKQLSEARDRLSLLLVHDLKNPLAVISMNLEHMAAGCEETERDEALRDSCVAADRMLQMIMDLLDVGKAEEGRLVLKRKRGASHELVRAVLSRSATSASRRGACLMSDLVEDASVEVDHELLTRVLENLVGNALRYVPPGGRIEVQSHIDDSQLVLRVMNNGPRIPPGVQARLFEKYGGDAAHHAGPNRGLGLYFCRLVLEAHGGTIEARNLAEGGVCFELRIPGALVQRDADINVPVSVASL